MQQFYDAQLQSVSAIRAPEERAELAAAEWPTAGRGPVGRWPKPPTGIPSIVTDKDGKATVTFTVPERSTAWRLLAKGITDRHAGRRGRPNAGGQEGPLRPAEAAAELHRRRRGRSASPRSTTTPSTRARSRSRSRRPSAAGPSRRRRPSTSTAKGIQEVAFKVELKRPETPRTTKASREAARRPSSFELTVAAGEQQDVSQQIGAAAALRRAGLSPRPAARPPPTRPPGSSRRKNMTIERPSLPILVGPTVEQSLLDVAVRPGRRRARSRPAGSPPGIETATSDLMAALGLQKLLGGTPRRRRPAGPGARRPDPRGRRPAGLLAERRRRLELDRPRRRERALRHVAGRLGAEPGPEGRLHRARRQLQQGRRPSCRTRWPPRPTAITRARPSCCTRWRRPGKATSPWPTGCYRERPALSAGGAGPPGAGLRRNGPQADGRRAARPAGQAEPRRRRLAPRRRRKGSLPWSQSPAELRALWALALAAGRAASRRRPRSWSIGSWPIAPGHRWSPDKATGPAALALCRWFAESRFEGERYKLTVFVNDVQAKVLDVDQAAGTQTIDVPAKLLKKDGKQRINFQIAGRGRYTYQCILGGFVPADKLQEHDRRLDGRADLRAGAAGGRRPGDPARLRRRCRAAITTFRNPLDATARGPARAGRAGRLAAERARQHARRSSSSTWSSPSRSPAARR